jgi:FAD:protein FMN transferase
MPWGEWTSCCGVRKNLGDGTEIDPKRQQNVIVLFLLAASAAYGQQPLLRLEKSADAMGSTYSVALYGYDRVRMEAAADAAFDEVRQLDDLLSNYKPESEWSEVNQRAAAKPMKVSPELFRLLSACVQYSRESEGAFDISVGPLMKVWGFYKGSGHLPHKPEVRATLAKVGYRHIRLDEAAQTVFFDRAGVELDPGGIGKGYAVDRMVDVLKRNGVKIAFVAASGSSIYGMGAPPDEPRGWAVKIKDPWDQRTTLAEVWLKDSSMSTSGSYEKFFRAEGKIYAHIMDPRTGYPAQGSVSVSVIAPRTIDSEAWAKPYFVNGRQWAVKHRPRDFQVFFCEDSKQDRHEDRHEDRQQDRMDKPCAWLQ